MDSTGCNMSNAGILQIISVIAAQLFGWQEKCKALTLINLGLYDLSLSLIS